MQPLKHAHDRTCKASAEEPPTSSSCRRRSKMVLVSDSQIFTSLMSFSTSSFTFNCPVDSSSSISCFSTAYNIQNHCNMKIAFENITITIAIWKYCLRSYHHPEEHEFNTTLRGACLTIRTEKHIARYRAIVWTSQSRHPYTDSEPTRHTGFVAELLQYIWSATTAHLGCKT